MFSQQDSLANSLPISMRHSVPNLASGRHMASTTNQQQPQRPQSPIRPRGNSRSYSSSSNRNREGSATSQRSVVDTRHIHVYIKQQGQRKESKSSMNSVNLLSGSRPISADSLTSFSPRSNTVTGGIATAVTTQQNKANTRIVLPNNPNGGRPIPSPLRRRGTDPNMQARRPRSHYIGEIVFQVDTSVYMGGVEAAYNANLLCRLGIEYIVDISNVDADKLPKQKRSDCPCLCPKQTAHSRARMTIPLDESATSDVTGYFREVNLFIEKAKSCKKCVLIHSYNGKNRCAVFAVEHMMSSKSMGLYKAEEYLKQINPLVKISDNFYRSLKRWENVLANETKTAGQKAENTVRPENRLVVPPGAKKTAWA